MNIGLKDLDATIASQLEARTSQLYGGHNLQPEDAYTRTVLMKRWKGKGGELAGQVLGGSMLGLAGGVALGSLAGNPGALAGIGFMGCYAGFLSTLLGTLFGRRKHVRNSIFAEELRAVVSGMALTTAEAAYIEVVCSLLEAGDNIQDATGKDILSALNTILERYRHIDSQLERLKKIVGTESVQALEEDYTQLQARVAAVEDAQARQDLTQSLTMCEKRLQDVRALAPSIERLEAQKEVLHQTLLTIQASVVRLQAAPRAVALPDTTEIRRAVEDVTLQTRAVEDAVAEVLVLQSRT